MSLNKRKYIFVEAYEEQLNLVLKDRSFGLDYKMGRQGIVSVTTEKEKITIFVPKIEITIDKALLPRYCKLELVEEALTNLEKFPENSELLKALGNYTQNNFLERKCYLGQGLPLQIVLFIAGGGLFLGYYVFSPRRFAYDHSFLSPRELSIYCDRGEFRNETCEMYWLPRERYKRTR